MRYLIAVLLLTGCASSGEPTPKVPPNPEDMVRYCEGSGPMKECWWVTEEQAERMLQNYIRSIRAF